ncbi:DUF4365 domain-containing protein [Paenibacillus enshidis]|uniref:DUF4365 domain-containing protein n=1 Tax=Paenibacillus enshidis TaxID=1458439 RepID=A0ABV5B030_9BACL
MAELSNSKKERLTVNTIKSLADAPGSYLIPEISVGDKGISFDGHISVMSDDTETKESLIGRVPVQVKGTEVEEFCEGLITFSFDIADYRNFLSSDGVLLLVGEVKPSGETKLYYKSLLALEIHELLQRYGKQKSRVIELRPIGETRLYDICCKFLAEQEHQPRELIRHRPFNIDDFQKFKFSSLTYSLNPTEPLRKIFDHDFTMYGILNQTHFPLVQVRFNSIGASQIVKFTDGDSEYDIFTENIFKESVDTLILENSFIFEFSRNDVSYRYLNFNSLAAQKRIIPMLISLFSGQKLSFEENIIQMLPQNDILVELRCWQSFLEDLEYTFDLLGINPEFVIEESKDIDTGREMEWLVHRVYIKNYAGLTMPDNKGFVNYKLGNKCVVLFYNPFAEDRFLNAFAHEVAEIGVYVQGENDNKHFHSIYVLLTEESLVKGVNLNIQKIKYSFDRCDPFSNELVADYTNKFCLSCINAYVQSGNRELLDLANYIYDRTIGTESEGEDYILINKLQIKLWRNEDLTIDESNILYQKKILAIKDNNLNLLFCVNVLLRNRVESTLTFEQMFPEKQEYFKTLPIFKFFEKL